MTHPDPTEWVTRGETTTIIRRLIRYRKHDLTDVAECSGIPVSVLEMILDGRIDPVHRLMHERVLVAQRDLRCLSKRMLPAGPLLEWIDSAGVEFSTEDHRRRSVQRARRTGRVSLEVADHLLVDLFGVTPDLVWGHETVAAA